MGIASIFSSHAKALGAWKVGLAIYAIPALLATLAWCAFNGKISKDTLGIIATVDAVIATVLLTVIGSIYSGLPSASRRARRARERFAETDGNEDAEGVEPFLEVKNRMEFEELRLSALTGLFAHAAAAVSFALASLPLIVVATQVASDCPGPWSAYLNLAVLVVACWTLALVWLVLVQLHKLVGIDSRDLSPEADA